MNFYFLDSSQQTWIDSVLQGLPLKGPGPGQWTPYTRRRLLLWTAGTVLLNYSHHSADKALYLAILVFVTIPERSEQYCV